MLNCCVLMGRLVADPELRTTSSGLSVSSFRIAVDRSFTRAGEERQTDFIDIVAWRNQADFVSKYFHKGSMIAVQGALHTRSYEDKNGNKRIAYEIVAESINFCGSKAETGTGAGNAQAPASFSNGSADDFSTVADDDDLPF